jgi:hypothetical protein
LDGSFSEIKARVEKLVELVEAQHGTLPGLEDWEYLIHHIHKDPKTGKEILHHCPLVDHLGNIFLIDHMKGKDGKFKHYIVGLAEDQDIYWSDDEAKEDGQTVPCANRQLKG